MLSESLKGNRRSLQLKQRLHSPKELEERMLQMLRLAKLPKEQADPEIEKLVPPDKPAK